MASMDLPENLHLVSLKTRDTGDETIVRLLQPFAVRRYPVCYPSGGGVTIWCRSASTRRCRSRPASTWLCTLAATPSSRSTNGLLPLSPSLTQSLIRLSRS
jgi:hypothetical protein